MPDTPNLFRVLIYARHWNKYVTFCNQYDKAAAKIDRSLVGTAPSRGQFHRWLAGQLRGLPYADHCRVLEALFPEWTATELFQPCPPELLPNGTPTTTLRESERDASTLALTAPLAQSAAEGFALPPVGIRPHMERAFQCEHVSIDFFGFSGETLHGVIQEPLDKIRAGQLHPSSVTIRLLLPDTSAPMAVPCRTEDLADDPDFRERARQITLRHSRAILDTVQELASFGLVDEANATIRVHNCPPLFKLYVLNQEEVFFGFYPIKEHALSLAGSPRVVYDLMGKDATLFRHSARDGRAEAQFVEQARAWFDSVWQTITREAAL